MQLPMLADLNSVGSVALVGPTSDTDPAKEQELHSDRTMKCTMPLENKFQLTCWIEAN